MRCRHWTTRPQAQTVVFPRFRGGVLNLLQSDDGMVAEVELQVSERVVGFVEQRGRAKTEHLYGPGSEYHQKPIARFFQTTGVCWYFPERSRCRRRWPIVCSKRSASSAASRRATSASASFGQRRIRTRRRDGRDLHLRCDERQPATDTDAGGPVRAGRRARDRHRGRTEQG